MVLTNAFWMKHNMFGACLAHKAHDLEPDTFSNLNQMIELHKNKNVRHSLLGMSGYCRKTKNSLSVNDLQVCLTFCIFTDVLLVVAYKNCHQDKFINIILENGVHKERVYHQVY